MSANDERRAGASRFSRILVGVDGTEPSLIACRVAARLAEEDSVIEAVAVVNLAEAVLVGPGAPRMAGELRAEAESALEDARAVLGDRAKRRVLQGIAAPELLREADTIRASMLALGSHDRRRASEILLGGTVGELLHVAPCSVLVAREPASGQPFPTTIVAGIDGSLEADAALAVAQDLSRRFGSELRIVTALKGKVVDLAHVHLRSGFVEELDEHPVGALVEASRAAELLVVGSRGLHGLRALGSVSERVAHKASCSTLVIR
jgi:nucleotide-binding universal stress UspA family protein